MGCGEIGGSVAVAGSQGCSVAKGGAIMRMVAWAESVRRRVGGGTRGKTRRRGSGEARRRTAAFVETLEDRCLLAAGDLDPSFGDGGKVITAFGASAVAHCSAIQSDGKIVVVGDTDNHVFALARYNSDGSLDTTFNSSGKVATDIGTSYASGVGVALQADGKIVVAGTVFNGSNFDFAVIRYNINGSLDTSFDGDGYVTTDFASMDDIATSLVIQPNGRIIVVGMAQRPGDAFGPNRDFALVRYNTNGSLDTTFDGDGKVTTDFPASGTFSEDFAYSVTLQSNGKIVVAGDTINVGLNDYIFALARYNSNGSLDTAFNLTGKLTAAFGSNGTASDHAASVAVQPDGKIVVAGNSADGNTNDILVSRFNANGSPDASFGSGGSVKNGFGASNDVASSMALQSDGKIVVVGHSDYFGDNDFAVMRFNKNGSLDTSFDGNGGLLADFGNSDDYAGSVVIQPNGRIVVSGYTTLNGDTNFTLARFDDVSVPRLAIATTDAMKAEGNTGNLTFTFTVTRTGDTSRSTSVKYGVAGTGTNAADAADFGGTLASGTVSFGAGKTTRTISIKVKGDTTVENDETFLVTLSNAVNADILNATATGAILNDDAILSVIADNSNLNEGNSGNTAFTFTVTRSGDLSRAASVKYAVSGNGTSSANAADFGGRFPSGTLNFAVGEATKTITVNVSGDSTVEKNEGFKLTLTSPTNATLDPAAKVATGTIQDDDGVHLLLAQDNAQTTRRRSVSNVDQFIAVGLRKLWDGIDAL